MVQLFEQPAKHFDVNLAFMNIGRFLLFISVHTVARVRIRSDRLRALRHTPLHYEELRLHFSDEEDEDENERNPPNLEEQHEQNVENEPFDRSRGKGPGQHFGRVLEPPLQVCRLKGLEPVEVFEQGRDCVGGFEGHVVLRHWIEDLVVAANEVDVSCTSHTDRALFEVIGAVFVL